LSQAFCTQFGIRVHQARLDTLPFELDGIAALRDLGAIQQAVRGEIDESLLALFKPGELYWAWSCWDSRTGAFHSAQGAGGIGWAYGAGLGGAVGLAGGYSL
jgi:hypothetical protein